MIKRVAALCAVGLLCLSSSNAFAGGFDNIGINSSQTSGTGFYYSQEDNNSLGDWYVTAYPFVAPYKSLAKNLEAVFGSGPDIIPQVHDYRVEIWSSQVAFLANPRHGDILDQYFFNPTSGSATSPYGVNTYSYPNYLMGFDFQDIVLNKGQEYYFGIYIPWPMHNAISGIAESHLLNGSGVQAQWNNSLALFQWFFTGNLGGTSFGGTPGYRLDADYGIDIGQGCGPNSNNTPVIESDFPVLGQTWNISGSNATPNAFGWVYLSFGPVGTPFNLGQGCYAYVDPTPGALLPLAPITSDSNGNWSAPIPLPNMPIFSGVDVTIQSAIFSPTAPLGFELSNGWQVTLR